MVQVPPYIVAEELIAAIQLPGADDIEGVVVQKSNATGPVFSVGAAQGGHEDAARPAVDGVRPRVAGLGGELAGLDGAHHLRG